MRILLVEDDETLLCLWRDLLMDAGHEVVTASTLKKATSIVRFEKFDVFMSDLLLNQEVCLPFLQTASYLNPNAHTILITGTGWFGCGELAKIAPSIDLTIRKPVSNVDLLAYVDFFSNSEQINQKSRMTA